MDSAKSVQAVNKVESVVKSLSSLKYTIGELESFEAEITGLSQPPSNEAKEESVTDSVSSVINGMPSELECLNTRISQVIIRLKESLI